MSREPPSSSSTPRSIHDGTSEITRDASRFVPPPEKQDPTTVAENTGPRIGRYEIRSQLGSGGFGNVYRAWDPELKCEVAIKVPRPDRNPGPEGLDRFRQEARTLARIRNHPSIVTVYDVGETNDGVVYAVMEFVKGQTLSDYLANHEVSLDEALQILMKIASALKAAHQATVVHRDLKPSNVILDREGNITLVDFGLALHDDLTWSDLGNVVEGTPKYMAPEQIRGENHRIDGQTDIWAFGVIMYRMMTGKHPFRASDNRELARVIRYKEPAPPRQLNPKVPKEIERICLKCLSKMIGDRYLSVPDLLEDLSTAIVEMQAPAPVPPPRGVGPQLDVPRETPAAADPDTRRSGISGRSAPSHPSETSGNRQLQITYKGLRPFDSNDKDFFLHLLPGPRTRDDIPESLQFWLTRIEGDELEPLTVGLIYGPSGCGKSSFVRAGLMPLLPSQVNPVYLECTPNQTEERLVRQIAHRIDSVQSDDSLPDVLRQFRRGEHLADEDRLLIILDQFEQWLYGNGDYAHRELTEALRQCDGERVICLLLVRDDFWMSTSEFMKLLEIPIREGHNALALPLFDERHARRVMVAYGRAFERLPASADPEGRTLSTQQRRFVREAVAALSSSGKVICVHLSVFAQIAKDREWTASELHRLGGLQGVGVRFLDDLFGRGSGQKYREADEMVVKSVLEQLLPGTLTGIKGTSRSREELFDNLPANCSRDVFSQAVDRLENDLHLISPTEGLNDDESRVTRSRPLRLAHDFLVVPIRDWLARERRETWRGRARMRIEELGERWSEARDRRFLPSPLEYLQTVTGMKQDSLGKKAGQLMQRAHRYYSFRGGILMLAFIVSVFIINTIRDSISRQSASAAYTTFLETPPSQVLPRLERLSQWRGDASRLVRNRHGNLDSTRAELRRAMAAAFCGLRDREFLETLSTQLALMDDGDVANLPSVIQSSSLKVAFLETCERQFAKCDSAMVRARIAIVTAALGDLTCMERAVRIDDDLTDRTLVIAVFNDHVYDRQLPLQILKSNNRPEVVSTMLAIIASQPLEDYSTRAEELGTIVRLLCHGEDANVHACATLLARKLRLETPETEVKDQAGWRPFPDEGFNMVRIPRGTLNVKAGMPVDPDGNEAPKTSLINEFWLADREVTNRLFRQFLDDAQYPFEKPDIVDFNHVLSDELPIVNVSAEDCWMFSNWLSWKSGRSRVYEYTDSDWLFHPVNNGFRIPEVDELEYACRCGSATALHLGTISVAPFLALFENKHGSVFAESFEHTAVASRIPNYWGLFDTLGNVQEICGDPDDFQRVFARGYAGDCYAGDRFWLGKFDPPSRTPTGLRVALVSPD